MNAQRKPVLRCGGILIAVTAWLLIADDATDSNPSDDGPFYSVPRPANIGTSRQDRAFSTAPPTVKHFWTTEVDNDSCLQCHAREFRIEKRHHPIRPVPHAEYTQCMQCHVRGNRTDVKPFVENRFVGLANPGKGQRAHPNAPPTIPHRVFMRDNCNACHGPTSGYPEYRTTHPNRSQCQQCHVEERKAALK